MVESWHQPFEARPSRRCYSTPLNADPLCGIRAAEVQIGMTLFEYLAIAHSLFISFAVLRALSGLPHALAAQRRYWIHLAWVCLNLNGSFIVFWGFWSFRDVDWNYGRFLLPLGGPALLYVVACILTPEEPSRVVSWREHFFATRIKLFTTSICFLAFQMATSYAVLESPLAHPIRLFEAACLALWTIGAFSKRPAVHATIVCISLVSIIVLSVTLLVQPGGFGQIARR